MYMDGLTISYMYPAIKIANQLTTLEDMLIPMRFGRSVSRRVFNIDAGDMPEVKAKQMLDEQRREFTYRKFYDSEKGTIGNTNAASSIVEDYWFLSRDGGRGVKVETLDESGNLGEMGDIEYFRKKLYLSLNVPMGRLNSEESDFDFGATSVKRDEVKFFNFCSKLKKRFQPMLIEILRRNMISKGVIKESDFDKYKGFIKLKWSGENVFFKSLELDSLSKRINIYNDISPLIGVDFSKSYVRKNVLDMTDEQIKNLQDEIQQEKMGDEEAQKDIEYPDIEKLKKETEKNARF